MNNQDGQLGRSDVFLELVGELGLVDVAQGADEDFGEVFEELYVHRDTWAVGINFYLGLKFFVIFEPRSFGEINTFNLSITLTV